MNSLIAALRGLRYSPLPYLLIAGLLALGAFYALSGGFSADATAPGTRIEPHALVITRNGVWVSDQNAKNGYVKVR